ncbi:MAG: hypothetical protein RL662_1857 [Bacteroidota bacterium]
MNNLNPVETSISLSGKKIHFVELELNQRFNQHHICRILIDFEELDKSWMNDPVKIVKYIGEPLVVEMRQAKTGETNIFKSIITDIGMVGKHGQQNHILIQTASNTIKLEDSPTMDSFVDKTLDEIVAEVAKTSGNGAEIAIKTKYKEPISYLSQWKESAFQFLNRLSSMYGEPFYNDGTNTYFGLPCNLHDSIPIMYDAEITSLNVKASLLPANISKYDYLVEDDVEWIKQTRNIPEGTGYLKAALDKSQSFFSSDALLPLHANVESSDSILKLLDIDRTKAMADMLTLSGTSQTCKIGIGKVIQIVYPPSMQVMTTAGNFIITAIEHLISQEGTYTNRFSGVRAALERVPTPNMSFPITSSQRAIVVANADPKSMGRVKVRFQWQLYLGKTTNWIRVTTPDGGGTDEVLKNRGFVFIPETGDEVMVDFEGLDPSKPYVSGSLFSGTKGEGGGGNNFRKSIMTRSGIKIVFNDSQGSLHIEDPSGNTWDMDGNGNIKVFAPKNINIAAGNNIHLSAGNDMSMSVGNDLTTNVGNRALYNIMQATLLNTSILRQIVAKSYLLQATNALINTEDSIKLESKETFLTGINKLFLHSDETATLNSKGVAEMKGTTKNSFTNVGEVYATTPKEITAKVIVHFRPQSNWKGEFGFDWMRMADTDWLGGTKMFGDNSKYEDTISKQYDEAAFTTLTTDINKYNGHFKKDPTMYESLKSKYDVHIISWRNKKDAAGNDITDAAGNKVPEEYFASWITLYPYKTIEVRLCIEVVEAVDEIKLISSTRNIEVTPDKLGALAIGKHEKFVKIECKDAITADAQILVESYKKDAAGVLQLMGKSGKVNIWSNEAAKRKMRKVVFVSVQSNSGTPKNTNSEKGRISSYLNQALIELDPASAQVDLPVHTYADFTGYKDALGEMKTSNGSKSLTTYLKEKLKALDPSNPTKYDSFFKAFYFNDDGAGRTSGYSALGADFVVVFQNCNDQTASHEFLHSLNLPHSFSNKEASSFADFTYQYGLTDNLLDYSHHTLTNGRLALWYWQWITANAATPDLAPAIALPPVTTLPATLPPVAPVPLPKIPATPPSLVKK